MLQFFFLENRMFSASKTVRTRNIIQVVLRFARLGARISLCTLSRVTHSFAETWRRLESNPVLLAHTTRPPPPLQSARENGGIPRVVTGVSAHGCSIRSVCAAHGTTKTKRPGLWLGFWLRAARLGEGNNPKVSGIIPESWPPFCLSLPTCYFCSFITASLKV